MAAASQEALGGELDLAAVIHVDPPLIDSDHDLFSNESGGYGIDIAFDGDGAPGTDPGVDFRKFGKSGHRYWPHHSQFLPKLRLPGTVCLEQHPPQPHFVGGGAFKVITAAQKQVLFQPIFQPPVHGLDITILLLCADSDGPGVHAEVTDHGHVFLVEGPLAAGQIMGGRRGVVRLMELWRMAQPK